MKIVIKDAVVERGSDGWTAIVDGYTKNSVMGKKKRIGKHWYLLPRSSNWYCRNAGISSVRIEVSNHLYTLMENEGHLNRLAKNGEFEKTMTYKNIVLNRPYPWEQRWKSQS